MIAANLPVTPGRSAAGSDRASAVPYGQAHRSAAAHKLHSTPQQDGTNLISGKDETSSRLPAFSYSSREAVQTTGTVADHGARSEPFLQVSLHYLSPGGRAICHAWVILLVWNTPVPSGGYSGGRGVAITGCCVIGCGIVGRSRYTQREGGGVSWKRGGRRFTDLTDPTERLAVRLGPP
jgi:hypothetical protein